MKIFRSALLGLVFVGASISINAHATDASITKSVSPGSMLVLPNGGTRMSQFGLISSDFPRGTLPKRKTLTSIEWQTTWYPEGEGETLELCYFRPYSRTEVGCRAIQPNSSGTINDFNNQRFDNGAKVTIFHRVNGGRDVIQPVGQDIVTFRYTY
ncbi:hypothetical protein [Vreelandella titanicae]|uniref:hypothetical protein n=1 Tax=Vreelandella titanicae TaxID=664683 RepID=UPI001142F16C|nr:hypothetical protein [Halomonas titanicae]